MSFSHLTQPQNNPTNEREKNTVNKNRGDNNLPKVTEVLKLIRTQGKANLQETFTNSKTAALIYTRFISVNTLDF